MVYIHILPANTEYNDDLIYDYAELEQQQTESNILTRLHFTGREQLTLSSVNVVGIHESFSRTRKTSLDNTPKYNCSLESLKVNKGKYIKILRTQYSPHESWGSPISHNASRMAMMSCPQKIIATQRDNYLNQSARCVSRPSKGFNAVE